jgi:hypothetical protein
MTPGISTERCWSLTTCQYGELLAQIQNWQHDWQIWIAEISAKIGDENRGVDLGATEPNCGESALRMAGDADPVGG